jgi:hypothetical protein
MFKSLLLVLAAVCAWQCGVCSELTRHAWGAGVRCQGQVVYTGGSSLDIHMELLQVGDTNWQAA